MMVWGSMWIFAKSNFSFYAVFTAFLVLWLKVTYRSMLPPTPKQERCKSSSKIKNWCKGHSEWCSILPSVATTTF